MTNSTVNTTEQACTLTRTEFTRIGAIAAARLLTCESASVLDEHTKSMLTAFCAIYHSEMEHDMFPSEKTDKKSENTDK